MTRKATKDEAGGTEIKKVDGQPVITVLLDRRTEVDRRLVLARLNGDQISLFEDAVKNE